MLPARFVAESLGAVVEWNGDKQLVTIKGKNLKTNEDVTILITIGAEYAVVNGENVKLDSPAFIENDRTYTPIRFISEHLGASVEWLENEQKVIITKKSVGRKKKLKKHTTLKGQPKKSAVLFYPKTQKGTIIYEKH